MKNDKNKRSDNKETLKAVARFSQVGFTMAASVFVGVWLGQSLDKWIGMKFPLFLLIFSLLGVGAAIRSLFGTFTKK